MKCLKVFNIVGLLAFVTYAVILVMKNEMTGKDILNCKSQEFLIQNSFLVAILIVFLYFAVKVNR